MRRFRERGGATPVALAAVLVAALLAFANVAEDYLTGDPLVRWDVRLATWLHAHNSARLRDVFEVVTLAGNGVVLLVLVSVLAVVLMRRRRAYDALLVCVAFFGVEAVNAVLKLIFHRPRPELAFVHLETYSFPSGHAAASTAMYGTLAYLVCRRQLSVPLRALIAGLAFVLVALVAFSRLYLGVHYLSDVLAGVSVGASWAAACLLAYTLYTGRGPRL